jgi:anthranilate synthase component 1
MDMAIAIRTAVLHQGRAYVQAGAGIVADSDPATEEAETRHKAQAVLSAIAAAGLLQELRSGSVHAGSAGRGDQGTA